MTRIDMKDHVGHGGPLRTAAGRAMFRDPPNTDEEALVAILAIEAEARGQERERIRPRLLNMLASFRLTGMEADAVVSAILAEPVRGEIGVEPPSEGSE